MSTDAAVAAAAEAFRQSTIESWTLYAIGVASTFLRLYARLKAAGPSGLSPEDYFMWIGIVFYTVQTSLAYSIGNVAQGLANNGMSDAERSALSSTDSEYELRIIGSKVQVAGWTMYASLMWALKMSMLFFYTRLTNGLGRRYRLRIQVGFGLVIGTYVASLLAVFTACIPFQKYWQISPNPGNVCQAAVSKPIVWVSFAANVLTDVYLIAIPVPMLWGSSLKMIKKVAATIVLGAGIFVLVCAIIKSVSVLVDPVDGAQLAGAWGTREAFVAVITTNLPLLFPLFRTWLTPLFGSLIRSSHKTSYPIPSGFRTIGGGGGGDATNKSKSRRGPTSTSPITANLTFNESEERIIGQTELRDMKVYAMRTTDDSPANCMVVSNEVKVTHEVQGNQEDKNSQKSEQSQRPKETW